MAHRPRKPPVDPSTFDALDIRVGTVLAARHLERTRKPFLALEVEFGPEVGRLQSAAQLTRRHGPESLEGRRVLAVVNLPPLELPGLVSQCLVLGVVNPDDPADVVLVGPDPQPGTGPAPADGWPLG